MIGESWAELIGHQRIASWFAAAVRRNRIGGSFLFVGSPGVGKTTVATLLARTLLCRARSASTLEPCGVCESCRQVTAETHPDVVTVRKPDDKNVIPLELLIGPPENRMREGFCRDVRLRPVVGTRKVAILHDADHLNEEGANCLLKTLEEPPPDAVIILIGTGEQRQLPTIRSRCQIVRFTSPSGADATRLLREAHEVDATDERVAEAMEIAGGDVHVAARLLRGEAGQARETLSRQMADSTPDPVGLSKAITAEVEAAGKDASKRRAALRDVMAIAVQTYRATIRREVADGRVRSITHRRLDRSLRALREIDRMANQATLIECFAADIAAGTTGDRGNIG